jgi:hypothetical protein
MPVMHFTSIVRRQQYFNQFGAAWSNAMQAYMDVDGDSGVAAYEIGEDFIDVQFKKGKTYRYTYASAGQHIIEQMKSLAIAGDGLNSFIMRNARTAYESSF